MKFLSDECISERDSDGCFYDCIKCVSENECVKCAEVICDVKDIGVLNECKNVESLCVQENNITKIVMMNLKIRLRTVKSGIFEVWSFSVCMLFVLAGSMFYG